MDKSHEEHAMDEERFIYDPGSMMLMHPRMYSWVQPVIMILGVWLVTSPTVFAYNDSALVWNDVITGLIIIGISAFALRFPSKAWVTYANALTGVWLLLAPLVFWAPNPASYANSTLIGTFIIAFSFIIPMSMKMPGPSIPPGWSYNPSTWAQRAPMIAMGLLGFFLSRPMAGYQLGYIDWVWEPFFDKGTVDVLTSEVSRAFPVSDAGLGAAAYLVEVLSTFMGDEKRWRTMPWMVAIFGLAVIPLGVTSIILVIMQPVSVGAWCTLCLLSAISMLLMVPLALDEVVAMIQFLNHSKKEGKSVWRTFWHGGTIEGASDTPRNDREEQWSLRSMLWGVTPSWSLSLSILVGVWLMASPAIFPVSKFLSDSTQISGALIVTISFISLAEVGRSVRYLNLLLGAWLVAGSWLLSPDDSGIGVWSASLSGVLCLLLSLPLGKIKDSYGTYNRWVWKSLKKRYPAHVGH